ncbi:MAG: hypothetical protein JWR16_1253 [Nevskia sp.]|nr:hypothetical protein [Nevskia sp.]
MNKFFGSLRGLIVCGGLTFGGLAFAHEGHDHGADHDDDAPTAAAPPAAGTTTTTGPGAPPQVELVVTRERSDWLIYIDDYASNAPIDGLQVQLRNGNQLLQAAAAGDGIYRLPADLLDAHGETPVTFLLRGKNLDLQLQSVLPDVAPTSAGAEHAIRNWNALSVASIAAVLVAVLAGLSWRRRRARTR